MLDDHTKSTIENEINAERSALADALSSLTEGFQPQALVDSLGKSAPELTEKAISAAKQNPLAAGVIGTGLALLAYGSMKAKAPAPSATEAYIAPKAERAKQTARQMRDALYDGTGSLSDAARARIVEAREKAIEVQSRIEDAAKSATQTTRDQAQSNPLAVCAGLAVAGAAVAMALPRSKVENDTFGAQRDALVAEAERIFQEEGRRLMEQGREAVAAAQEAFDYPKG